MTKTKIPSLAYNIMFKVVFSNNKVILSKLIESILAYCKMNINIKDKELIIKNNELPLSNHKSKQLICDYLIKLSDTTELEKIAAIIYCKYLEDISSILENVRLDMKDKEKFIDDVKKSKQRQRYPQSFRI